MTNSTYELTLANDYTLYANYHEGDLDALHTRANQLYQKFHHTDCLTLDVRITALANVCTQWQTGLTEAGY